MERNKKALESMFSSFNKSVFSFRDDFVKSTCVTRKSMVLNIFDFLYAMDDSVRVNLPIIAVYDFGELKNSLTLEYYREKGEFRERLNIKDINVPEFMKKYFDFNDFNKRKVKSGNHAYFKTFTEFSSDLSLLEKEISEGRKVFGDEIYIASLANWGDEKSDPNADYSIVGRDVNNGKLYLVGTTQKERKTMVSGRWENGFDSYEKMDEMIFPKL